jgi:spore maturation protein SpmB
MIVDPVRYPILICFRHGAAKGWRGFVWMFKIILPISLATFWLDYSGWLHHLDVVLEPLMGVLRLPAIAALPLLVGLLTGIYGAVAAMSILPFTVDQMTLMAVFLLIAHSLIQEGVVQHQSGCPAWVATAVRLAAATMAVVVLGWLLGTEPSLLSVEDTVVADRHSFVTALFGWASVMAWLSMKILLIIVTLMIFMELLKRYRLIDKVVRMIEPCLGILGLDKQVGVLWLTAVVFGITYGGAVIVEETRERRIPADQLKRLHVSIGINHAMVEDPALFLPLGIHPVWLWAPRLLAAVVSTHLYRLWGWMKRRRLPAAAGIASAGGG